MTRHYDYLSKLGVRVHDLWRWSVAIAQKPPWIAYVRSDTRFHTTQDRVWLDGVEEKKRQIHQWLEP